MLQQESREVSVHNEERMGWIEVPGGRVWYRGLGVDKPCIPLLLAHGGPGYSSYDLETFKDLADERPVYFWDQLDNGESQRENDPNNWTLERFVRELAAVRSGLKLDKVHLYGLSWGGLLVNEYMLTQKPEGIQSVTFASPMLSIRLLREDIAELLPQIKDNALDVMRKYEEANDIENEEYQDLAGQIERHFILGESLADNLPPILQRSYDLFNKDLFHAMVGHSPVSPTGVLKDYDRLDDLHNITVPVLFTGGRNDLMSPRTLERCRDSIPDAELAVFEQSAHMAHFTERDTYMATMRDFLRRAEGQTGRQPLPA